MSDFNEAFQLLLKSEGGFVDNPADKGKATNYGITLQTLSEYLKKPVIPEAIKFMTVDLAKDIYKTQYWDAMRLDEVKDTKLATIIFNLGVLRGVGTITKDTQSQFTLKMDGFVGNATLAALNASDPSKTSYQLIRASQKAFLAIVQNDISQMVFLKGWLNRTALLTEYLFDIKYT